MKPAQKNAANVKREFPKVVERFKRELLEIAEKLPTQTKPEQNATLLEFSQKAAKEASQACEAKCDANLVSELFKISIGAASRADYDLINKGKRAITYEVSAGALKGMVFSGLNSNKIAINESEQSISNIINNCCSAVVSLSGRGAVDAVNIILEGLLKTQEKIKSPEFKYSLICDVETAWMIAVQLAELHESRASQRAAKAQA